MTVDQILDDEPEPSRESLLEHYGRRYGDLRLAIEFTETIDPARGDPKKCTTKGWDKTKPLANGDFGAALLKGRGQFRNPVVVLRTSNLLGVECDTKERLAQLDALGLPTTVTVRSSEPFKQHRWFRAWNGSMPEFVAFRFEAAGITADAGRYLLAPPALHPSGSVYSFLPGLGPHEVEIAELPEEQYAQLVALAKSSGQRERERLATEPGAPIAEGARNSTLASFAGAMRRPGMSEGEILAALQVANRERCTPPLSEPEVEAIAESVARYEPASSLAHESGARPATWQPIDLAADEYAKPSEPPMIADLIYARKRHALSGPPEAAKTLVSLILALEHVRAGGRVAHIDFEMEPADVRRMLSDLGATLDEIRDGFLYFQPDGPPQGSDLEGIATAGCSLAIIDALAGAYDASALDDNKRADAERFAAVWIKPLWQRGIATIALDHVVKASKNRGAFSIGSERKLGAVDVHLGLEAIASLSRGGKGLVSITTHKDRPGWLTRPRAAVVELLSDPETHAITWAFKPASEHTDGQEGFRPTVLMEKVSRYLEQHETLSRTKIEQSGLGKSAKWVRAALDALIAEGYVQEHPGPRNARLNTSVRPFRQSTPSSSSDPVSPRPDEDESTSSTPSPPYRADGDGDGDGVEDIDPDEVERLDNLREAYGL